MLDSCDVLLTLSVRPIFNKFMIMAHALASGYFGACNYVRVQLYPHHKVVLTYIVAGSRMRGNTVDINICGEKHLLYSYKFDEKWVLWRHCITRKDRKSLFSTPKMPKIGYFSLKNQEWKYKRPIKLLRSDNYYLWLIEIIHLCCIMIDFGHLRLRFIAIFGQFWPIMTYFR